MAPLRLVALPILALTLCSSAADGQRPPHMAVIVPGIVLDERDRTVAAAIGLDPHSVYIVTEGVGRPKLLATSSFKAYPSKEGASIAVLSGINGRLTLLRKTGEEVAIFNNVIDVSWSEDGTRLALLKGRRSADAEIPQIDSLVIYDPSTGRRGSRHVTAAGGAMIGRDSVLLSAGREMRILDLRRGRVYPSNYHGTIISPNGNFSISRTSGGRGPRIWDEDHGFEITAEIQRLLGGRAIRPIPAPFWVNSKGRNALLCVPACRYARPRGNVDEPWPDCGTFVVDVKDMRVVQELAGRAICPSTDRTAVVMLRGQSLAFEDVSR